MDDRAGAGRTYGNLGNAYKFLGDNQKAIGYHEKDMKIAMEVGDQAGEGRTYRGVGNAYDSQGVWSSSGQFIRPSSFLIFSLMTLITLLAFPRVVSMQ